MNWFQLTFKSLNRSYYFRFLILGILLNSFFIYMFLNTPKPLGTTETIFTCAWCIFNAFMTPYAYFAWDSIEGFIWGDGVIITLTSRRRLLRLFICVGLAFLVAPIGLMILYFMNKKAIKQSKQK